MDGSSRAPPAFVSPSPPAGFIPARWAYVDAERTHQVVAGVRPGATPEWIVRESAYQNDDPREVVEEVRAIEAPWETQLFQWELESRLSGLGTYWKHDATQPGWRQLTRPQGARWPDTREFADHAFRGRVTFHHVRGPGDEDIVILALATTGSRGPRHLLARARLRFPDGAGADLRLLHAHLPAAPARSLLVRELLASCVEGTEKLVGASDITRAHGLAGPREVATLHEELLRRVSEGRFGAPSEDAEITVDPLYTDFFGALADPRLLGLQARFFTAEEQDDALARGEAAIRQLVARRRASASRAEQHLLTVVEASLVARDQLRPGRDAPVDPEVASLVRRFSHYL